MANPVPDPPPAANVLGGYRGQFIYGVLPVPNNTSGAASSLCDLSGKTCPVVYHCGKGISNPSSDICEPGYWAFATKTSGGSEVSCIRPYYLPNVNQPYTDTSPTPYNWMAQLTVPPGPLNQIPAVNGKRPHLIPYGQGDLGGFFAAFTDSTPREPPQSGAGCSAPTQMIVAYDATWFVTGNTDFDLSTIQTFLQQNWLNSNDDYADPTGSITYNGLQVQSVQFQVYNFLLAGDTVNLCGQQSTSSGCSNGANSCSNYYAVSSNNLCQNILTRLFVAGSTAYQSGENSLSWNYSNSAEQYCTNAAFPQPNSSGDTGPPECFCLKPEYSGIYNLLNVNSNPAVENLPEGCWWQPCRNSQTTLPDPDQWDKVCQVQECVQIIEGAGGTINNQGTIRQYLNCNQTPQGPSSTFEWWPILVFIVVVIIIFAIIFFIARNTGRTENSTEKEDGGDLPDNASKR